MIRLLIVIVARWRYATVTQPFRITDSPICGVVPHSHVSGLFAAGDWTLGHTVGDAFASGHASGNAVTSFLKMLSTDQLHSREQAPTTVPLSSL